MSELKEQLDKVNFDIPATQDRGLDAITNFIYTDDFDTIVKKLNELDQRYPNFLTNYGLKRWAQYKINQFVEGVFCSHYRVEANENKRSKTIDLFIDNVPFDVKVTVYPKRVTKKAQSNDTELIKWYYRNQGAYRKHFKNKIFVVCAQQSDKKKLDVLEYYILEWLNSEENAERITMGDNAFLSAIIFASDPSIKGA